MDSAQNQPTHVATSNSDPLSPTQSTGGFPPVNPSSSQAPILPSDPTIPDSSPNQNTSFTPPIPPPVITAVNPLGQENKKSSFMLITLFLIIIIAGFGISFAYSILSSKGKWTLPLMGHFFAAKPTITPTVTPTPTLIPSPTPSPIPTLPETPPSAVFQTPSPAASPSARTTISISPVKPANRPTI